ncbi:MAG: FAD-dependent oxidoreductase [Chloroflexota bacterium]|nr:FAD-dependent oxidoreductase [Chloroflexota bacterium]
MAERNCDILIVGGGTGGCAAAMGAASQGYRVIMTEVSDWVGGQLTSQAVPPDEHPWVEQFGCTRRYRHFRNSVRDYYRDHYPLLPASRADPHLNPGVADVSRIAHEPRVALAVLEQMLAFDRSTGRLQVLLRHEPIAAETEGDRVQAVTLRDLDRGEEVTIAAPYILDATELGDLLRLAGVEYVTGAESRDETGEPHAVEGPPQPDNVQSLTWCFPMAYDHEGEHTIEKPAQYERWRDYVPQLSPPWSGPLFSWVHPDPVTHEARQRVLFPSETSDLAQSLWYFRRIICRDHYPPDAMPYEVTLVNWPQIDYWEGNIIDKPEEEVQRYLDEAKQLSLSWLYWMQTDAPRPDGGIGYPGLYLRPDIVGATDGLAKQPYIRESRRIKAAFTVTELHVGAEAREGGPAAFFEDSVGVGCYRIDLHPSTGGDHYIDISSLPFQIPLGALLPVRVENLLPACKNIGTTHITNGCYRLHPVEWNIGEAAGLLAAYCLQHNVQPRQVREQPAHLQAFQSLLRQQGVELEWPRLRAL